jgi:hypothetical protein
MSSCLSREAGPLRAAVVAQISSNPAAQNDGVTSSGTSFYPLEVQPSDARNT